MLVRARRSAFLFRRRGELIPRFTDAIRLDVLAPKAGQNDWLSRLVPALDKAYPEMCIQSYPGLAYAKALCLRNVEQERKSVSLSLADKVYQNLY